MLGGKPVVVVAEQALVHALAILGHALTVGACELDVARERRRKGLEVVLRARLLPDLLAFGARAGALDHQLFGRAARARVVSSRDAHHVALELRELEALELIEPRAHPLVGGALVREAREQPELLCARVRSRGRHRHLLVPPQQHLHGGEVVQLAHAAAQLLEGVHALQRIVAAAGRP